jgi:hypothetical protein
MKKTVLILTILLVLTIINVSANDDFALSLPAYQEGGIYEIVVPKQEFVPPDTLFNFHVHVFNSTSGAPKNTSTTNCLLRIYLGNGTEALNTVMTYSSSTGTYYYAVNLSTIGSIGLLPFIVICGDFNGGSHIIRGGFYSGVLKINEKTKIGVDNDGTQGISMTLFITILTLIIFLLPKLYGQFSDNKMVNLIIVRCCYIIGFFLIVMNTAVVAEIAVNSGYDTGVIFRYMWLFGKMGYLMMFFVFIKTIFDLLGLWKEIVSKKRGFD